MQRAAIIAGIVACVLGLTAWTLLRGKSTPPTPPPAARAWMSAADPGSVTEVRVRFSTSSNTAAVRRLGESKLFTVDLGRGGAFLAREEQVRGALRLLAELDSLPTAEGGPPEFQGTLVTVVAGQERSVEFSQFSLAGGTTVRLLDPAATRTVIAGSALQSVFTPEGMAAWRDDSLLSRTPGEPSLVRIDRDGRLLELARSRQRWGMMAPVVAPAEGGMCVDLLARLSEVTTRPSTRTAAEVETLPAIMVLTAETPMRGVESERSLRQTVRLYDGGGRVLGVCRGTWVENESEREAWGPVTVELEAAAIASFNAEPGPFLARVASQLVGADVQGVRVGEMGVESWRAEYARTIDGWAIGAGPQASPALPTDQDGLKALISLLCDTRASAATLQPPDSTPPFARVSLVVRGTDAEAFEFSTGTVPLESFTAPVLIVRIGKVSRVYPAGACEAVIQWLRAKTVPEG